MLETPQPNNNEGLTPDQRLLLEKYQTEQRTELTQYELAEYHAYMENHPAAEGLLRGERKDFSDGVKIFESLIRAFEAEQPIQLLYSFTTADHLKIDEQGPKCRETARFALRPIIALLRKLENETTIKDDTNKEIYQKVLDQYRYVSRAIGIVNGNDMVDHTR